MTRASEDICRTRRSASVALILVLVFASSLPYFFVGPLPAWIFFGVICVATGIVQRRLSSCVLGSRPIFLVVVSWLLLLVFMLVLDVFGQQERDLLAGPALGFFTGLTFLGVLSAASYTNSTVAAFTVFVCAGLQGVVSILQFVGIGWAWSLPETITTVFSSVTKVTTLSNSELMSLGFEGVGRTRGTHHYVHIFNGIQATLVAYCFFVRIHTEDPGLKRRTVKTFLTIATLLALVGLLLSFSRSGLLAIFATVLITLAYRIRVKRFFGIIGMGLLFLLMIDALNIDQAHQFTRLIYNETSSTNISARLEHLEYALQNFRTNPLIGASGIPDIEKLELPIHSVPLRFLNDYGLIGFTLYCSIFGGMIFLFIKAARLPDPVVSMWGACGLCVASAIIVDSWVHSSGFLRRDIIHAVMLALVAGNLIAAKRRLRIHEVTATRGPAPALAGYRGS